jgi:hypothetical protein
MEFSFELNKRSPPRHRKPGRLVLFPAGRRFLDAFALLVVSPWLSPVLVVARGAVLVVAVLRVHNDVLSQRSCRDGVLVVLPPDRRFDVT